MILLDTHIWVWWANESPQLSQKHRTQIERNKSEGIGVSVISCWEVANLVRLGRLELTASAMEWVRQALSLKGIQLLELSPEIAVEATLLKDFHKDPADRFLVATALSHNIEILTQDGRILSYSAVRAVGPS
jgi:PIN domain nuclease of toxin-antitoxin system